MATGKDQEVDFLVIGSGIAGMRAAIELASAGRVLLISKGDIFESGAPCSQPGVALALGDDEEVFLHLHDTLRAGDGLCREPAVRTLVEEGPPCIQELIAWGARFDPSGTKLSFARESAHSRSHVLRAHGGSTGREMLRALIARAKSLPTLEVRRRAPTVDLLMDEERVCGAMYLDESTEAFKRVRAGAVLLATGGLGQVYAETTNHSLACGDGIGLAFRKGALLSDMEFIQFHPTVLQVKGAARLPLSGDLRAQGAKLRNIELERFMTRYHEAGELAPPDVVSRAILLEMQRCRSEFVYLDLSALNAGQVKKRFPGVYAACLQNNIDITADLVPVRPAAHYAIGGISTDLDGATTVKSLYAAGEVATNGVHGANGLASNWLLEGLVYGARAARAMIKGGSTFKAPMPAYRARATAGDSRPSHGPMASAGDSRFVHEVRRVMWEKVGIIRHGRDLNEAIRQLDAWSAATEAFSCRRHFEEQHLLDVARVIARCAVSREESRGVHYRVDFPLKQESAPPQHSYISKDLPVYFAP